jgi:hypothetical protein
MMQQSNAPTEYQSNNQQKNNNISSNNGTDNNITPSPWAQNCFISSKNKQHAKNNNNTPHNGTRGNNNPPPARSNYSTWMHDHVRPRRRTGLVVAFLSVCRCRVTVREDAILEDGVNIDRQQCGITPVVFPFCFSLSSGWHQHPRFHVLLKKEDITGTLFLWKYK